MRLAKLGVLALASVMGLAACQASVSAEQTKATLLQKEYKVSVITSDEFDKTVLAEVFPMTIGLEYYLTGLKGADEYLFAWYFMSIENATSFSDLYSAQLSRVPHSGDKSAKSGQKNNVVYYGTDAAVSDSGLGSFF